MRIIKPTANPKLTTHTAIEEMKHVPRCLSLNWYLGPRINNLFIKCEDGRRRCVHCIPLTMSTCDFAKYITALLGIKDQAVRLSIVPRYKCMRIGELYVACYL